MRQKVNGKSKLVVRKRAVQQEKIVSKEKDLDPETRKQIEAIRTQFEAFRNSKQSEAFGK